MADKPMLVGFFKERGAVFSKAETRRLFERLSYRQEDADALFSNFDAVHAGDWNFEDFLTWIEASPTCGNSESSSKKDSKQAAGALEPPASISRPASHQGNKEVEDPLAFDFRTSFAKAREEEEKRIALRISEASKEKIAAVESLEGVALAEDRQAAIEKEVQEQDSKSHPPWRLKAALTKKVMNVIVGDLLDALAPGCPENMEIAFARAMSVGSSSELFISSVLQQQKTLEKVAREIQLTSQSISSSAAPTGAEMNDKFKFSSERGLEMVFGTKADFFLGLEARLGSPDPSLMTTIIKEHCCYSDCLVPWTTGNYGITTMSLTEFLLVAREVVRHCRSDTSNEFPSEWHDAAKMFSEAEAPLPPKHRWPTEWPKETINTESGRRPESQNFLKALLIMNKRLEALGEKVLLLEEGMLLRLYTGPLFEKYNIVPRGGATTGCDNPFLVQRFQSLCGGKDGEVNRYITSIHTLTSGVVKLSKLTPVQKVFRGLGGNLLPRQFWEPDSFGCKGGVEFGFMSTTSNREVAMRYSGDGSVRMVLELETGLVDRGADLQALSQYPSEKEILFAPLTSLEVRYTETEGSILVVKTKANINLRSPTIDEVVAKRYQTLRQSKDTNMLEAKQHFQSPQWRAIAKGMTSINIAHSISDDDGLHTTIGNNNNNNNNNNNATKHAGREDDCLHMTVGHTATTTHSGREDDCLHTTVGNNGKRSGNDDFLRIVDSKMESVLSDKAIAYNNDNVFLAAMERLVHILAEVRDVRSGLLRDLGTQLQDSRLVELADEREDLEVAKQTFSLSFKTGRAGMGDLWVLRVLGVQKAQDGCYYALKSEEKEYRNFLLSLAPLASQGIELPQGTALLSANGRRDIEIWAEEMQEVWRPNVDMKVDLVFCAPRSSKEFSKSLLEKIRSPGPAANLANFLLCNSHQKEIDLDKTGLTDEEGRRLLEAVAQTAGRLSLELLIFSNNNLASGFAASFAAAVVKGCLPRMKLLQLFNNRGLGEDMKAVKMMLSAVAERSKCLEVLDISGIGFRDEDGEGGAPSCISEAHASSSWGSIFGRLLEHLQGFQCHSNPGLGPSTLSALVAGLRQAAASVQAHRRLDAVEDGRGDAAGHNAEGGGRLGIPLKRIWLSRNPKLVSGSPTALQDLMNGLAASAFVLEELRLHETGLAGPEHVAVLAKMLPNLPTLKFLSLYNNQELFSGSDAAGMGAFMNGLGECSSLEDLRLFDTGLAGAASVTTLGRALRKLSKLRVLMLYDNPKLFSESDAMGIRTFMDGLGECTSLKDLWLHNSGLWGASGALAMTLPKLSKLWKLTLYDNPNFVAEGDIESSRTLLESLGSCPAMEEMLLNNSGLCGASEAMSNTLLKLPKLRKLMLHNNPELFAGDIEGCRVLMENLVACPSVEELVLSNAGFCGGQGVGEAVSAALPKLSNLRRFRLDANASLDDTAKNLITEAIDARGGGEDFNIR